jgi:hypothetical protein
VQNEHDRTNSASQHTHALSFLFQAELKATYGVDAVALAFDFANCSSQAEAAFYGQQLPEFLAAAPVQSDVGLLINNGMPTLQSNNTWAG